MQYIREHQSVKETGYVYKIQSLNKFIIDTYIGSTISIIHRLKLHVNDYRNGDMRKLYEFMRQNGGINTFELVLLWKGDLTSRKELIEQERMWQLCHQPTLNTNITGGGINRRGQYYRKYSFRKLNITVSI